MADTYFRNDEENYAPLVRARVYNVLGDREAEVEFLIDTGFQGGILIPLKTYVHLDLNLFEEQKAVAQTAVGSTIELRVSRAVVEIGETRITCTAYTALGVKRALLGREVLKKLGLLYRPPRELKLGMLSVSTGATDNSP